MASPSRIQAAQIVRDPKVLGGEPTIKGTRVPVWAIVLAWRWNPSPEYLREAYPMVSPEAAQAALAFYEEHQEEIDRYIAENEADLD
jgi:uncharacterized protein (DUF433 family)